MESLQKCGAWATHGPFEVVWRNSASKESGREKALGTMGAQGAQLHLPNTLISGICRTQWQASGGPEFSLSTPLSPRPTALTLSAMAHCVFFCI